MNNRNNSFMPQIPFGMNFPTNMMMFPNYMNDNYGNLETRVSQLEKKVKVLENKVSRLEMPYQNNNMQNYQNNLNNNQNENVPYQTTQNNAGYNVEMYMM